MSLRHALLTALLEKPASGLELAKRFDRSIAYFWNATHQQIYRELSRMEAEGLIESTPEENARGVKKIHRVLPQGRKELKRWVGEGGDPAPLRDPMMVRLRAEGVVGPAGLADSLRAQRKQHLAKRALYREFEAKDFSKSPADRAAALRYVVLKAGLKYEDYWIEMLDEALAVLDEFDH
ncbi:MAG: PadR family transcriptional regulator [Spongiibacteraceae bacterium]|jgi:DNA-binding PadR family transcriptional regulator|nr:PadR family transcriptional regulator [Spongiibacteraceae bacterium]